LLVIAVLAAATPVPRTAAAERILADALIVNKAKRELLVMRRGAIARSYRIALGRSPVGAKARQGDGRTPEGDYVIDSRNAKSRFHRALHISYPGPPDRTRAATLGIDPGGDIMIHGLPRWATLLGRAHRLLDWTEGCIALTNEEIDELWDLVPDGTPIRINP
jgi:murein L,D-transpeptidase YafK